MHPKVSICLITYNHVNYIKEAIDGVLNQVKPFTWELIIADDFSTDGTRQILLEYKEQYSSNIKLILQDKNIGPARNWLELIGSATGQYVAYFDGDDYWTDVNKLKKQIEFLDKNLEYNICFHNASILKGGELQEDKIYKSDRKKIIGFEDLLSGDYTKTCCSIIRRTDRINHIPVEMAHDTIYYLICLEGGEKAYYIDEDMAVYRVHQKGLWSLLDLISRNEQSFEVHKYMLKRYSDRKESKIIKYMLRELSWTLFVQYTKKKHLLKSIKKWLNFVYYKFI